MPAQRREILPSPEQVLHGSSGDRVVSCLFQLAAITPPSMVECILELALPWRMQQRTLSSEVEVCNFRSPFW